LHTHEDSRRTLVEWAKGAFKVAKIVTAKSDCTVGDHYHRNKDETFYLHSGHARRVIVGDAVQLSIDAPAEWNVPRGTYHAFDLAEGSVLLGTATEEFDPEDEIKGRP
jgi:oxalate decarboxylase/phosphoglucose isomerase-like protein (cupin superfamily)